MPFFSSRSDGEYLVGMTFTFDAPRPSPTRSRGLPTICIEHHILPVLKSRAFYRRQSDPKTKNNIQSPITQNQIAVGE
jgi:hypothetical protein